MKVKKPKLAIISLTSCEGCQFVLLDQGKKFLDLLKKFEVEEFRLIEDDPMPEGQYDVCLVEGNPVTKENIKLLKAMRERSKFLIVLGNCAALGGVWEIKNYQDKKKTIRYVYQNSAKVENPDIKEVDNFVEVDLTIPGCPVTGSEMLEMIYQLLSGKMPRLPQSPVCWECQTKGYECLLQKGMICLGPITLGGCQAVCLKSKQPCWGCRGLFEGAQVKNHFNYLTANFPRQQAYRVMEVFGVRDSILKSLVKGNKTTKGLRNKKGGIKINKKK
ncbi:MAG: NADH:ubiquinone oxidoreductase [Patescibacteria group bacterium]